MINEYIVLDLEMTGLSAKTDQIIEIGAIKICDGKMMDSYTCIVNAHCSVPERVVELTGITDAMLCEGMEKDEAIAGLLDFLEGHILVGQNLNFDYGFLKQWAVNHKRPLEAKACDTLKIARELLPADQSKKLSSLCEFFEIKRQREHRALDDAIETWQVFECLEKMAAGCEGLDTERLFTPHPLTYRAKKQTPATQHQVQRLKEYREKHKINNPIEWENLTRSEASRIMDKYVLTHGR